MKIAVKTLSVVFIAVVLLATGYIIFKVSTPSVPEDADLGIPNFAKNDKMTAQAYNYAIEMQDEFQYIACYCGCGMHAMAHRGKIIPKMKSLKDCFIRSDGTFEDHAALDCPACIYAAVEAGDMLKKGISLKEVRGYIDGKYGTQGGGTDTPYPSA